MKTLLTILTLIFSLSTVGQEVINVKMRCVTKPIIKAEINGKKGYFLVDTGAAISLLNSSDLKRYDLTETKIYNQQNKAVGFSGQQANLMKVKNVNVIIGEVLDHRVFYSTDLDQISSSIMNETNIRIVGIIGTDILMKYNCIIDYNQRLLTMIDSKSSKRIASK